MTKVRKRNDFASIDNPGDSPESVAAAVGTSGRTGADRDRIAMRAYELYLARGAADGSDFDDWLAAERELASLRVTRGEGPEE